MHNTEEAITFPRYLPLVLARLPETWRSLAGPITLGQVWAALAVVTLIPFALAAWATLRPEQAAPVWLLLLVQATLLLNVIWHVSAAIVLFDGYAPGLATAVLLNLPFSIYLIRRAARELGKSASTVGAPAERCRDSWACSLGAAVVDGKAVMSGFDCGMTATAGHLRVLEGSELGTKTRRQCSPRKPPRQRLAREGRWVDWRSVEIH